MTSILVWKPDGSSLIISDVLKYFPSWCSLGKNKQCRAWFAWAPTTCLTWKGGNFQCIFFAFTHKAAFKHKSTPNASLYSPGSSISKHTPIFAKHLPSFVLSAFLSYWVRVHLRESWTFNNNYLVILGWQSVKKLWVQYLLKAKLLSPGCEMVSILPGWPWECRLFSWPLADAGEKLVPKAELQSCVLPHQYVVIKILLLYVSSEAPATVSMVSGKVPGSCAF